MNQRSEFAEAAINVQFLLLRTSDETLYQHDDMAQIPVLVRMYGSAGLDIKQGAGKASPLEQWARNTSNSIADAKTSADFTTLTLTPAFAETQPVTIPLSMFASGISYLEDGWHNGWLVDHLKNDAPELAPYVAPFAAPIDRATTGVTL